ncbi:MAG: molybdopterin-dependent oxidoreductase [Oscillospiraceae bacterium]|nr:molybdopterin-dependent oxidoreductase [Oscillospiraceae bacterium]
MKKITSILMSMCLLLALFACNSADKPTDAQGTASPANGEISELLISGLPEGDFVLTWEMLKSDYEVTEREAMLRKSSGDERLVRAKGVLLENILRRHGVEQREIDGLMTHASDGYAIELNKKQLEEREVLLAFEIDGEELELPRIVIPEERGMYWTKFLIAIEIQGKIEEIAVTKELSLTEIIEKLKDKAEEFKYYDAICLGIPTEYILEEIGVSDPVPVVIKAKDGLTRNEKFEMFAGQLIVFEGTQYAPLYIGANLPRGMRVKEVVSVQIGGILLVG